MPSSKKSFDLRFLTCNDVYRPGKFACLKTMIPKFQGKGVTKCVMPGDFLGGSLFSVSHQGSSMIEVINEIGFDYVTLGNHEFDFGSKTLESLMDRSSFKWLGSNVRYSDNKNIFHKVIDYETFIVPSVGHNFNAQFSDLLHYWKVPKSSSDLDLKVGVFGVCTEFTPKLSNPGEEVVFENVLEHVRRVTKILKETEKCDVIIALTHVSLAEDKLIAECGNINLILGGHEHEPYLLEHRDVLIMKCGQNIDYLGVIDMHFDVIFKKSKNGDLLKTVNMTKSMQLLSTAGVKADPKIEAIVSKWEKLAASSHGPGHEDDHAPLTVVDESCSEALSTKTADCRMRETAFCCLLADAYKWICEEEGLHCDFAIQNGGFIRADTTYPPGTPITRAIIKEELPFAKKPMLVEMQGKYVIEALSDMLPKDNNPTPLGSYPHLSSGLRASYDLNFVANGRPCKVFDVKVGDQDIDPEKTYRVATSSFYVLDPADGVTAFNNKTIIKDFDFFCSEAMCKYLSHLDSISSVLPERLINLSK